MRRELSLTRAVVGLLVLSICAQVLGAADARFFRAVAVKDFLAGTLDGIAVDPAGTLTLAGRVARVADLGEPFVFSLADHPKGWVVGTGNGGKVLLVGRDGSVETLLVAAEPEIFSVWADEDGTVFAGSSPHGRVYRIEDGESEVFFEPGETYIWDLARAANGRLLVATGTEGRLYEVETEGRATVLYDSEDTHLRNLEVLAGGDVLLGTAGEGLILRLAADGSVRTLYDGTEPEVVALTEGADGVWYAALLASEASLLDLTKAVTKGAGEAAAGTAPTATQAPAVTVATATEAAFTGSRPSGYQGPRSLVLRIAPSGIVDTVWRFEDETVYALRWHEDRLWVGTGLEGKLYSFRGGKMVLEKDVDERQIVAFASGRPGPAFATTNASAIFSASRESEPRGTYTSAPLDAGQVSRFGTLRWLGQQPEGSRVRLSVRTGMSAEPDRTWSSWSAPESAPNVALASVAPGRFLQWKAELEGGKAASPTINEVTVSYLQENLAPKIESFSARAPGEIVVPANFNPGTHVFEPTSPTRGGIFTTLEAAPAGEERRKTLWKKGFQTLTWKSEDPNGDDLTYALQFKREAPSTDWLPMVEDLDEEYYSFDAAALPDGTYRFRLRAADRAEPDEALVAEEITAPVVIDHTAPVLRGVSATGDDLEAEVEDALSPLRRARFSVDAGEWQDAAAADGMLDAQRERLTLPKPREARLLLLQVMDAAFNLVTFDLSRELP